MILYTCFFRCFGVLPFFFFFFFLVGGLYLWYMEVLRLGVESELIGQPTLQPQQLSIRVKSATYTTAHGNTRSLTHWLRPGIESASSWLLLRFISTVPQWKFHGEGFIEHPVCIMHFPCIIWLRHQCPAPSMPTEGVELSPQSHKQGKNRARNWTQIHRTFQNPYSKVHSSFYLSLMLKINIF